jgi:cytochrome c553
MKIFVVAFALIVSLTSADTDQARGLRRSGGRKDGDGHGGGGRGGRGKGTGRGKGNGRGEGGRLGFLQNKVDEISLTLTCPEDTSDIDCVFDRPEREEVGWSDLDDEERAALKAAKEAEKAERATALALCVKCTGAALADLLPEKEERSRGSRLFGEGKGGGRDRGRGRGKSKGSKRGYLEDKVNETCESDPCPDDTSDINCIFERPEREEVDWSDLDDEEKANLKEQREDERDDHVSAVALCVCCTAATFDEVIPDRPREGHSRGPP